MASGSLTTNAFISTINGACAFSDAQVGANGSDPAVPEVIVGYDSSDRETTERVWDTNLSDGLDSGSVTTLFSAEVGGGSNGVSWSVAGATNNPIIYTGRTYGAISRVKIRAAVKITGTASWTEIQVKFYRLGRLTESYSLTAGISANSTSGSAIEQILEVTPNFTTNTKVTVSGKVRLQCPEGMMPESDDLFTQVFLFADGCNAA